MSNIDLIDLGNRALPQIAGNLGVLFRGLMPIVDNFGKVAAELREIIILARGKIEAKKRGAVVDTADIAAKAAALKNDNPRAAGVIGEIEQEIVESVNAAEKIGGSLPPGWLINALILVFVIIVIYFLYKESYFPWQSPQILKATKKHSL